MTNALRSIAPQFMPDGNAVFNTCLQFGGAAGTALFSTVLSVAQAGAGKEGTEAFSHATAVGGSWMFTVMIVIVAVAICCLITAFRIGRNANNRVFAVDFSTVGAILFPVASKR